MNYPDDLIAIGFEEVEAKDIKVGWTVAYYNADLMGDGVGGAYFGTVYQVRDDNMGTISITHSHQAGETTTECDEGLEVWVKRQTTTQY